MERRFHFQELNWILTFPKSENCGRKYPDYSILISDLKKSSDSARVRLDEIVENPQFQDGLPHTVGFYKSEATKFFPKDIAYLELRIIRSVEDFWKFLNDLDL